MNKNFQVEWPNIAENDLKNIVDYIAEDSPSNDFKIFKIIKQKALRWTGFIFRFWWKLVNINYRTFDSGRLVISPLLMAGWRINMLEIKRCLTGKDFSFAMQITKDYIRWLNMDLSFQDIDKELSNFPSMYGPPNGLFLLAWHKGKLAGGVGLRMFEPKVCEMKRLFVRNPFKNKGVGRSLCTALIQEAKKMKFQKMRLDTLGRMKAAIRLYESLGFEEIEPYRFNPDPTTKYMELSLR